MLDRALPIVIGATAMGLVLLLLVLPTRPFEQFAGSNNSHDIVRQAPHGDVDRVLAESAMTLGDKDGMLQMRRCYQITGATIHDLEQKRVRDFSGVYKLAGKGRRVHTVSFSMMTCGFRDVESKILCEMQKFYVENVCASAGSVTKSSCQLVGYSVLGSKQQGACPLNGQGGVDQVGVNHSACQQQVIEPSVYVIITQAPRYKNASGQTIVHQFNADSYDYAPTFDPRGGAASTPTMVHVQMWFGRYSAAAGARKGPELHAHDAVEELFIPMWDRKYRSKDMLCFMHLKEGGGKPGGCASTVTRFGQTGRGKPYGSLCLGRSGAGGPKNRPATYVTLYRVNPGFGLLKGITRK